MKSKSDWNRLADEFKKIIHPVEPLWADWDAYEGSENYGVWLLIPDGPETYETRVLFGSIVAKAIAKLNLAPIPIPEPSQHFPQWTEYCAAEEARHREAGKSIDLSDTVRYGMGHVDQDAVDPCTRAWLELLRRESTAFKKGAHGTQTLGGKQYRSVGGRIRDVCAASAVYCDRDR